MKFYIGTKEVPRDDYASHLAALGVILTATQIRPINEWPIWAKALKQFSTPEDKGIGDVVARMIGDETSAKFKAWHLATFGKPCGCTGRQKLWNTKYPLT